jgi:hypothetical protein
MLGVHESGVSPILPVTVNVPLGGVGAGVGVGTNVGLRPGLGVRLGLSTAEALGEGVAGLPPQPTTEMTIANAASIARPTGPPPLPTPSLAPTRRLPVSSELTQDDAS